jgi:hypothetical protein
VIITQVWEKGKALPKLSLVYLGEENKKMGEKEGVKHNAAGLEKLPS